MNQEDLQQLDRPVKRLRPVRLALVGLAFIVIIATLVIVVDPFGLHLIDRWRSEYDAALTAVPFDSTAYIGVNFLSDSVSLLDELEDTFAGAAAGTEADFGDLRTRFEQALESELGISLEEDVVPWLGQYAGFAIVGVELDEFGNLERLEWVLSAETRARNESDRFLATVAETWESSRGQVVDIDDYDGVTIYRIGELAFGRSGSLVLLASSTDALTQAIDAQDGTSLADAAGYKEALGLLPKERLLTTYLNGTQLNQLIASIPTLLPRISPENLPTAAIQGTAISLSLVEEGVQLDTATVYDPAQLTTSQKSALESTVTNPETVGLFPEDTLLYLTGKGIDTFWASLRRSLVAEIGRSDFQESMRLFQQEFGINPDEALFPLLDGEAALGVMPSTRGSLVAWGNIDLGVVLMVASSQEAALASNLRTLSDKLGSPQGGIGIVTESTNEPDLTLYEFETVLVPDLLLAYGTGQGYLLIGTSEETLQSLRFNGGQTLEEREDFRAAWDVFPQEMSPGLFVDVPAFLSLVKADAGADGDAAETVTAVLRPIRAIAAAGSATDHITYNRVILFVARE